MSLRARITAVAVASVALALVLVGAVVLVTFEARELRALDEDLHDRALELVRGIRGPRPPPDVDRLLGRDSFAVLRRPANGEVLLAVGDVPPDLPVPAADGASTHTSAGREWRVITLRPPRAPSDAPRLQVGTDLAVVDARLARLRRVVALVGGGGVLLTAGLGWFATGVATRPLRRLTEATRRIAATEDLTVRVDDRDAPAEIAEVAGGLNTMLDRLERSTAARLEALEAARRFAADAGHELRTPLTSMQADLDALVRNPDVSDVVRREVLIEVAAEQRRLTAVLDALQALARADAGLGEAPEPTDVTELVDAAVLAASGRHAGVTYRTQLGEAPAIVHARPTALRVVIDNLLSNAAVHGAPDGTVDVAVRTGEDGIEVIVDDDGPGVPPLERSRIFDRFARGRAAVGRPGSGLGLALAAQLVRLHGGLLTVGDAPTGGARFVVRLPTG